MKQTLLITLALLLFSFTLQSQWVQISQIGNNELRGVKFFNEYTGIIVGQGGIWRSTNSGVNWTQVLNEVNMNALSFPDNNTGYAVGDSGKIYKCTDGGINWVPQISGITDNLYSVSFFNISTGHAVGQNGRILRTQTAGGSWYQNINQLSEDINCVQMITNSSTAIAVGTIVNVERYLSTANGGTNWVYSFSSGGASLKSVYAITQTAIIATGTNGRIRKSTNSGATWTVINSGVSTSLNSVYFIDINTGYVFGNNSTILISTNGGINWSSQTSSAFSNFNSCSFINATTAWAVGSSGTVIRIGIPVNITLINTESPKEFELYQNYPNPFNPITKIFFDINISGLATLLLYGTKGVLIAELFNKYFEIGKYYYSFDASKLSSGVYYYKLTINGNSQTNKMIYIK